MSWNCQGIGNDLTVRRLKEIISKTSPDILFLMETKNQEENVLKHYRNSDFSNHFLVPPVGLSGGLALSWKDSVNLEILSSSANCIDTIVEFHNKSFFVSYVYGAPQREGRAQFWENLTTLGLSRLDKAWLITGDFNDLLDNSEKIGGPLRWEGSFLSFRSFISQNGIWDLQHSGNSLSWRGTRYNHFIQSRLDRAMSNIPWSEMFPAGRCEYLRFEGSDHRPVITYFDANLRKKKGMFRYDRRLRDKPEIRSIVDESWSAAIPESVITKLSRVRTRLVEWSKEQNKLSQSLIQNTQAQLELELSAPLPNTELICSLQQTLASAYRNEEHFWRQRSRIQWLNAGDRNTGYFHAITRGRRALNKFSVIEDSLGTAVFTEPQIVATITGFYRDLFTSESTGDLSIVEEVLSARVTAEMNACLIAIPDYKEIKEAAFAIHADKAPGPDGFSASFYQSFWDIIGNDVSMDIRSFFETGSLHQRQNETHVRLIPKVKGPKQVSDYRPIALCNTHYKIIAKIITKRLQAILPDLISCHQSAFVPGRAIGDNVLITHEILHFLRTSGAKQRCSMAIKTDMSKAYDRIEWDFLREVLSRLGFHETWIGWVMECVSSVSYSFLVNGAPQGHVYPSRGLRQGDPLSPYLFILCTEVLSGLCSQAQRNGSLPGVKVGRHCPPINHLLFADDTMFFCRSNPTSCNSLMDILDKYEKASGQCINRAKSAVTFSSKTSQDTKAKVKLSLRISNEGGIGKYLGLPEHFGRKKRDIFAGIVDKIRQKAHGWTSRYLSGAGKLILLKAVLSAMPSYAMTCFKLPQSLCKQIQSVLTRFWWDAKPGLKKMCWVAWDKLTLPKSEGGLGFREIQHFNDALLAKVAWRLVKDPSSLLSRTLLNKYCKRSDFLHCEAPSSMSHGWRGILAGREVLQLGLGWIVGNGNNINIWTDNWLSTSKPQRPMGPPPFGCRDSKVSDLLDHDSSEWNITAIRQLLPQYEDIIQKIMLSSYKMPDTLVWLPEKSGSYTTRSGYALAKTNCASTAPDRFNWYLHIWNIKTLPKLKLFLWKAMSNALPVGTALSSRGLSDHLVCKGCGETESTLHVLLHCRLAQRVWDLVPAMNIPEASSITSISQLIQEGQRLIALPPTGLSVPIFPWLLWNLWTSRNKLLFEDKSFSGKEVVDKAIIEARAWQNAQLQATITFRPQAPPRSTYPSSSTVKCYTDASWLVSSGRCGLGWVFIDANGTPFDHGSSHRSLVGSALVAEALAVKACLLAATSSGHRKLECFSDSKSLISILAKKEWAVEIHPILHDIFFLCLSFDCISFSFVPRLLNVIADGLAKSACFQLHVTPSGA